MKCPNCDAPGQSKKDRKWCNNPSYCCPCCIELDMKRHNCVGKGYSIEFEDGTKISVDNGEVIENDDWRDIYA